MPQDKVGVDNCEVKIERDDMGDEYEPRIPISGSDDDGDEYYPMSTPHGRTPTNTEPPPAGKSKPSPATKKHTLAFWKNKAEVEQARGYAMQTIYMNQCDDLERLRASAQEKLDCANNEMSRLGHSFEEQKLLAVHEMERMHASWETRLESQKIGSDKMDIIADHVMAAQNKRICQQDKFICTQDKLIHAQEQVLVKLQLKQPVDESSSKNAHKRRRV